jgi:hypothetical protein
MKRGVMKKKQNNHLIKFLTYGLSILKRRIIRKILRKPPIEVEQREFLDKKKNTWTITYVHAPEDKYHMVALWKGNKNVSFSHFEYENTAREKMNGLMFFLLEQDKWL